ncbi:hypothetical protein BJX76DRAFT_356151 [Aspergillus varians]
MSAASSLRTLITNQSIIELPLSQLSTSSSETRPQTETLDRLASLNPRNSNSSIMPRPSTSNRRDSLSSSNGDRLSRTESPLQMSRSGSNKSRKSTEDRRRYDNTVYHYGRHSNYWLFGGFSVRDTVRDGVDWVRQQKKG